MTKPAIQGGQSAGGAAVILPALPFTLPDHEALLGLLAVTRAELRALDAQMTVLSQLILDAKGGNADAVREYRALEAKRPHLWYRVRLLDAALWLLEREEVTL
ncbi:hypothetical protein [Deinococcus yavapaiensis]|uniref:Uncharacterized protein n=1 Tax=Deinococcus yavapaiensis KR-236 TaxID=694435 RepID=A0A318S1F6_9DEIO|nr:hypothetical protein [Deinococcus yavapaiensis]PYE48361.1 hypothetical protein DES52_1304 [Deinococcus yavapaiensis KR-236]